MSLVLWRVLTCLNPRVLLFTLHTLVFLLTYQFIYYSNEQRRYVLDVIGDLLPEFGYRKDLPMNSKLDFVAPDLYPVLKIFHFLLFVIFH